METTWEFVVKNIVNAIIIWEKYGWKDDDLWELF